MIFNEQNKINKQFNEPNNIYTINQDINHQLSFINAQHIHQYSTCTKFIMHLFHYTYQIIFNKHCYSYQIIFNKQCYSNSHVSKKIQFSLNLTRKKNCKVITNNFWFLIETNNNQTFFLMYKQYSRTCDVHLTSTPYLSSWLRWLKITEQYNHRLFIDFNKYLMVLGSNRYPTHRQLSL